MTQKTETEPLKIDIVMVEREIAMLMKSDNISRMDAKYLLYRTLEAQPAAYDFGGQRDLIMGYLSPTRVVH